MKRYRIGWIAICLLLVGGACDCSDDVGDSDAEENGDGGADVHVGDDTLVNGGDIGEDALVNGGQIGDVAEQENSEEEPGYWELIDTGVTSLRYVSSHFIDEDNGWLLAEDNTTGEQFVIRTIDGGHTWEQLDAPNGAIRNIFFHDQDHGWLPETFGPPGQDAGVWRTENGGEDWEYYEVEEGYNNRLEAIYFVDENTGWVGGDAIFRTDDGGKSWTTQLEEDVQLLVNDAYFVDESVGTMVGNTGLVFHTRDGGQNWDQVVSDEEGGEPFFVSFLDAELGWIRARSGRVLHTEDGGQTWTEIGDISDNSDSRGRGLGAVSFIDADRGWVGGGQGEIHRTTDGGVSWELEQVIYQGEHTVTLLDLYMIHEDLGFAAGGRDLHAEVETVPVLRYSSREDD